MYEACGEGFAEPTEYIRQMLPVTLGDGAAERGLDLPLQLAGRPPAADRLRAVSGEVGVPSFRDAPSRRRRRNPVLLCSGIPGSRFACPGMTTHSPVNSREKPDNLRIFGGGTLYPWSVGSRPRLTETSPMRFTPQFLDELRARLPVSEVVGRRVKLKKAGREWKGLSPFQQEKIAVVHGQRPEEDFITTSPPASTATSSTS